MSGNARKTALKALERVRKTGAFSDSMLAELLKTGELDSRDKALSSRLCYGVLQNSALLDFYIDHLSGGKKLEPKLRDILRLSMYQLLFMDRIPAHAAVSEGVELCRSSGLSRACGLVNALLRRAAVPENLPELPETEDAAFLSLKFSVPEKLAQLFIDEFGFDFALDYLRASNEIPMVTLAVNTLRTGREELSRALENEGISTEPHPYLDDCLLCAGLGDVTALDCYRSGLFYIQDAAAHMAVLAAAPVAGWAVLDACSAPGGKSFSAAALMENRGEIFSRDIHEKKLAKIRDGAERLGIDIINTAVMDASAPDEALTGRFDLVIADVPCSGLGVLRKKPDIRYKDLEAIKGLPKVQLGILEGLCSCVKAGGTLLYSTCTVLSAENEKVISAFLEKHPEFTPEAFELPCPEGRASGGMLTLYPNVHGTDGFFICKLRKSNEN